jgi:hypothetical protein
MDKDSQMAIYDDARIRVDETTGAVGIGSLDPNWSSNYGGIEMANDGEGIESAISLLQKKAAVLHETAGVLEKRLTPVLMSAQPREETNDAKTSRSGCLIEDEIWCVAKEMERTHSLIAEILDRLRIFGKGA